MVQCLILTTCINNIPPHPYYTSTLNTRHNTSRSTPFCKQIHGRSTTLNISISRYTTQTNKHMHTHLLYYCGEGIGPSITGKY